MRRRDSLLIAVGGLCLVPAARAQDREPAPEAAAPDIEFLEYLGSWQADDDEVWALAEWDKDNAADADKDRSRNDRQRDRQSDDDEKAEGDDEDRDDDDDAESQ
jgi:hypothetical protein